MCKPPNEGKITTIFPQCLTQDAAKVDLSPLYSSSDLLVEHAVCCDTPQSYYCIFARCSLPYGKCPYCGRISHRVHSKYMRTIADLSMLGRPVIMKFEARKFFCDNQDCRRKTFAEQPSDEVFRYRRRTRRCEMVVAQHGLKSSSESARKLLTAIGVRVSGDTVLRDIHRMSVPSHQEVHGIGVDDWAFRKGVTYGSIIVSLDTGEVIDLLGDRDVESFRGWLDSHARVRVVSRDRSTDYSAATFYDTIMGDSVDDLTVWLKTYAQSPLRELRSLAYGIQMDLKAVQNAIATNISNGIVEGYVNKLKAVKRTMYGRASLALLKRKMVFSDLCFN